MSYHDNPAINDTCLAIINDGNGEMCGMTYKQRCEAADIGIDLYRAACRHYSHYRKYHFESRQLTRDEIITAATIIQDYYRRHNAEWDAIMKTCQHGHSRRQCELCERDDSITTLTAENAKLTEALLAFVDNYQDGYIKGHATIMRQARAALISTPGRQRLQDNIDRLRKAWFPEEAK